ncbi:MAG TPA: choice-of-anchor B family protein, partial [Oceanospirillales bacterium]|nr:choice-of-anchor B family protein [Oceanospirillales bacterium]
MKKIFFLLTISLLTTGLFTQTDFNLSLISNISYDESASDIWGFVDAHGNEYAIIGTHAATRIVSLADPSNPIEVANIAGVATAWRDIKSYHDFIYVVTDGRNTSEGILVIDMSNAPDSIAYEYQYPEIIINGDTTLLGACHNIYVDENGYAYLAGCNVNNGGVLFFDCFTDPAHPKFVAAGDPRYSHDAFVKGDMMWSSDINEGFLSVSDVSDKHNPILLATQITSSSFTHNVWLSDDGQYLFTTDELPNAFVDAYDVSDLSDIRRLDSYRPAATLGTGVYPHNVHYDNGYLVISFYTDGIKIVDAHRP